MILPDFPVSCCMGDSTEKDIWFTLEIDEDGCVTPLCAYILSGGKKWQFSDDGADILWDMLDADEQTEIVSDQMEKITDPAEDWDENDNGNPQYYKAWRRNGVFKG